MPFDNDLVGVYNWSRCEKVSNWARNAKRARKNGRMHHIVNRQDAKHAKA